MESKGLMRVLMRSLIASAAGSLISWPLWDGAHALGLLFGGVWSAANIWAIKGLVEEICNTRRFWMIAFFAHLKLPILYGIGAVVVLKTSVSVGAAIVGFHIPFVMIVIQAIVLGNQEARTAKTS